MSEHDDDLDLAIQLRKRTRVIVASDGTASELTTVQCPLLESASSLENCLKCSRLQRHFSIEGEGYLQCRVPKPSLPQDTQCGELVSSVTTCLDSELNVSSAAEILEQAGLESAHILDDNHVLVGMVSLSSLVQLKGNHIFAEVEDAMSTEVVSVKETTTIFEAASLMRRHHVDQLAVVTENRQMVGTVSALDIVCWVARQSDK